MRASLNTPHEGKVTQNIYTEYPNRAARRKIISRRPDQNWYFIKWKDDNTFVKVATEEEADQRFHTTRGFKPV